LVLKVIWDQLVFKVLKAIRVTSAHRVIKVPRVTWAIPEQLVLRDQLVRRDHEDIVAIRDLKVTREMLARKV